MVNTSNGAPTPEVGSSKVTDALAMSATGGITGAICVLLTFAAHQIWPNVILPEAVEQAVQVIIGTLVAVLTHLQLTK